MAFCRAATRSSTRDTLVAKLPMSTVRAPTTTSTTPCTGQSCTVIRSKGKEKEKRDKGSKRQRLQRVRCEYAAEAREKGVHGGGGGGGKASRPKKKKKKWRLGCTRCTQTDARDNVNAVCIAGDKVFVR